ncbi:MAG: hypothetical protein R3330_16050, partial [Saprospiraceae bacterium]|nr:hypothetical protein [Saprospiraceae bacterium]
MKKSNPAAFHNYLLSKYEMYKGRPTVASVPYCISIDPSDRCQLHCPTCATGIENASRRDKSRTPIIFREDRKMMGEDLFNSLIDELGERLLMIMFYNWGEP